MKPKQSPEETTVTESNLPKDQAAPLHSSALEKGLSTLLKEEDPQDPPRALWRCASCFEVLAPEITFCIACGAMTQDPLIGRILVEKYAIRRKIGEGGFGAVYEADHLLLASKVAIKVLRHQREQTATSVERFRREALATSRLTHPYAVKVFDRGETPDGLIWIAMEFLAGETLQNFLRRGFMSEQEFLARMGPVFDVLQEAHDKGIVHRDLKPENIMLVSMPEGGSIAKVLDFGMAGLIDSATLTQTGTVSGTPKYMAPEQWDGLKNADVRSDIYALGVIAYQCLSGRFPFEADSTLSWMKKHCSEAPLDLATAMDGRPVSPAFRDAVMCALSKKGEDRQQTVREFRLSLEGRRGVPSRRTAAFTPEALSPEMAPTIPAPAVVEPDKRAPFEPSLLPSPEEQRAPLSAALPASAPLRRRLWVRTAFASLLLGGGLVSWFLLAQPENTILSPKTTSTKPSLASQSTTQEAAAPTSSPASTLPTIAVGRDPREVKVGDLNNDGHVDIAVANDGDDNVRVLLGNGDGTFQAHKSFVTDDGPQTLVILDLNNDQNLDIAVAHRTSTVVVFLGKGDGTFQRKQSLVCGIQCVGVVAADFNRDKKPDIAATNARALSPNGTLSVFIGNGDGTFQDQQIVAVGTHPNFTTTGDFNADGALDLVTTNQLNSSGQFGTTLSTLLGNGDGTFQVYKELIVGAAPASLAVEDFNGDGLLDIAVANSGSDAVGVLFGNGDGTFQPQRSFDVGLLPIIVVAKDFNGDGEFDLATSNAGSKSVTILLGDGNGTFSNREDFSIRGNHPTGLAAADFDSDGALDIVVSNGLPGSDKGSNDLRFLFSLFR